MKQSAIVESILFAAGEPVSLAELASVSGSGKRQLREVLDELSEELAERGIRLVEDGTVAQLVTAPESASAVARYVQNELRGSLSQAALETLAIVAYNGPVTRPKIEAIRGVQSSPALRTLAIRGLVAEVGRSDAPGRPIIYDITVELMKALGIRSRDELPLVEAELAKAAERVSA
jgi:segregation and condensation protein B